MVMYARRIDTSNLKQYDDGLRRGGCLTHVEQESRESHTPVTPSMPSSQRREAEILTGEAGEGRPLEDDGDGTDADGLADGAGHLSASNASRRIIASLADQVGVCHH